MCRQGFNGRAEKGGLCWKAIDGEFEGVSMEFGLMKMVKMCWNLVEGKERKEMMVKNTK